MTFRPHFYFGETNEEIDSVFYLNGLPIVALELKHEKNQNVHDAVAQFTKRDHTKKIFQHPFLYFAADTSDVMAATDPRREENEILNIRVVSIGLIDRTPVHPREVFADALSDRASAVIVAHNHPSGALEPSPSDIEITGQLKAAGAIVGIDLLDHIIFNRTGCFSFLEEGRL